MAEGSDLLSVSVQKLDEELTCPVCQDHFEEPRVLPCLHYYCKKCVANLISRARGKPISCPECRRKVQVEDNDPESLPTAFFVNRMEEVYSVMKKAEPKENVKCENCLEHLSVAFCQNCGEYICEECMKAHKKLRQFASHVIVSLDSLCTSMTKNESVGRPVVPQELKCHKHKDEPLKLYCHTCYKLICRDCIVFDHSGHKYAFVVDVAPQCKSAIKEKAASLQNVSSSLKSALASLADSKKKLLDHGTATMKAIDGAHDKIASQLQQKRKELKEEATKRINASTEEINTQQKNAQLAMGEAESILEFLHRNLEKATDQELLSLQKQISDQADRIVQFYANPAAKFPVPRLPKLEVQCSDDVLRVLQDDFSLYDKAVTRTLQWKGSVHKLTSQLEMAQQQMADSQATWKETMKQKEAAIVKLTSEKKSLEKEVAQLKTKNQGTKKKEERYYAFRREVYKDKQVAEGAEAESTFPDDWEEMTDPTSGKEVPLRVIDLPTTSEGYQFVVTEFHRTMRRGANYNSIVKIQRVQNPGLYGQYAAKKKHLDTHNPSGVQNERWLFYGIRESSVPQINKTNFNRRFHGQNGTVYGQGCYFARDASYSNGYSPPNAQGLKYMYLARVLTGQYTAGRSSMLVAPRKDPSDATVLFDSVVDNTSNPSIYVVFYDADAYPEYLIIYN